MKAVHATSLALLILAGPTYATAQFERVGAWYVQHVEDKMNDEVRTIAFAEGRGGVIVFKCDKRGPQSVYVQFIAERYLGRGRSLERRIKIRIDRQAPFEDTWFYNKNYAVLLSYDGTMSFAERMKGANRLIIHAYNYEGEVVEAEIDISGADEAVRRVKEGCKAE